MSERRENLHEEIEEEYKSYANELQKHETRFIECAQNFSDYLRDDDLHGARYHLEVIQARVEDALSLIQEMEYLNERLPNREA